MDGSEIDALIYKGIVSSEMVRRQILSAYELEF
jgi:hypothetical protein